MDRSTRASSRRPRLAELCRILSGTTHVGLREHSEMNAERAVPRHRPSTDHREGKVSQFQRSGRRVTVAAAVAGAVAIASGGPAAASHGDTKELDTPFWDVMWTNFGNGDFVHAQAGIYDSLEFDVDASPNLAYLGDTGTHVIAQIENFDADYTENWFALWSCNNDGGSSVLCVHAHVQYNTGTWNLTQNEWKSVACEEHGHAAGLGHRGQFAATCMDDPTDDFPLGWDDHDEEVIDLNY